MKAETLFKSINVVLIASIVSRLLSFGRGVVFARVLEPVELGTWALAIHTIEIAACIAVLGVPSGFSRYAGQLRQQGSAGRFIFGACFKVLCMVGAACTVGFFFLPQLGLALYGNSENTSLVALTLVGIVATVGVFLVRGVLQGLRLFRVDAMADLLFNFCFIALVVALFGIWRCDALANAWAYAVTSLLSFASVAVCLYAVMRSSPWQANSAGQRADKIVGWRMLMIFSLGTWFASSLHMVWRYLDRFMLLHVGQTTTEEGLRQIGDYFVATKLAEPLGMMAVLVGVVLLPHVAHLWERQKEEEVSDILRLAVKLTAILLMLGGVLLVGFKSVALRIVVGYEPQLAGAAFAPVVATVVLVSLYYILRNYVLCKERTFLLVVVWGAALAVNFLLNLVLIPRHGLYGAVLATLVSALAATLAVLWLSAWQGFKLDFGTVAACVWPVALVLPIQFMLPAVAAGLFVVVRTDRVLTTAEKQLINDWFFQNIRHLVKRNKAISHP